MLDSIWAKEDNETTEQTNAKPVESKDTPKVVSTAEDTNKLDSMWASAPVQEQVPHISPKVQNLEKGFKKEHLQEQEQEQEAHTRRHNNRRSNRSRKQSLDPQFQNRDTVSNAINEARSPNSPQKTKSTSDRWSSLDNRLGINPNDQNRNQEESPRRKPHHKNKHNKPVNLDSISTQHPEKRQGTQKNQESEKAAPERDASTLTFADYMKAHAFENWVQDEEEYMPIPT